jgi:hypothetical protein
MPAAALPTCTFGFAAFWSLLWRAKRSMSIRARAGISYTEHTRHMCSCNVTKQHRLRLGCRVLDLQRTNWVLSA